MYIDLVHIFLLFDRACRTNDVTLYSYALGLMCPLFFATHKPNYARWMSLYHLNLLNMEKTHPGIGTSFEGGALSVRRTKHSFSRSAVDITLEQTLNRDAASRHGGIASFTQNINARKRWTVTRSFRGAIVSSLLEAAGITLIDDSVQELKPFRIESDNRDLSNAIAGIENTLNPFSIDDDALYCLNTGRAASDPVKNDLLHCRETGSKWYEEFVDQSKDDPGRFEKAIKRRKVKNFTNDAVKVKVTTNDKRIIEARCTRDIFGRLLFCAVTQKLDIGMVLTYPLTPVPFSLCHITGDMNKTSKSVLMDKIEAMGATNDESEKTDVYIIDTMFFLRALNLPSTFGGMAATILKQACVAAKVVHLVSDTYPDGPSIKDFEHDLRGDSGTGYRITGPSQKRPADLSDAFRSSKFKRKLLAFLRDEWASQTYAPILEGHELYFALEQECHHYVVEDGTVRRTLVQELRSEHEEADTRLIFHANFVAEVQQEADTVVVIRSNDTDVFILLLYHARFINAHVWMDVGVNAKNNRRMVDISRLATQLTRPLCDALPSFHALTGCDYTASFMRKAKWKPFKIMRASDKFTTAMSRLGECEVIDPDVAATVEEYLCVVYGVNNITNLDEVRLHLFRKLFAPKEKTDPLKKIKAADPCCLPPCKRVLEQKLRRTNFVAFVWKNARKANPVEFGPDGHGWEISPDKVTIVWYTGKNVPKCLSIEDGDLEESTDDESEARSQCSSDEEQDLEDFE